MRLGGWGGPRYGGITLRLETGFGAARFSTPGAVRRGEPATAIGPSWILQIGPRAEFLIPAGSGVVPLSFSAAYRMVQPLNSEAQALHGLMGSIDFRF